jgi:hypothetical protein
MNLGVIWINAAIVMIASGVAMAAAIGLVYGLVCRKPLLSSASFFWTMALGFRPCVVIGRWN